MFGVRIGLVEPNAVILNVINQTPTMRTYFVEFLKTVQPGSSVKHRLEKFKSRQAGTLNE